jgi:nucleoside-diphosphate-sugar epimerase
MSSTILVIGACGQIGSELTAKLRELYGDDAVIASDINSNNLEVFNSGPFETLDATNLDAIKACVEKHKVETVYQMVAMLSATGEKYPMKAWSVNMESLFNVLNLAKDGVIKKVFWPSSIAVFGPTTPKINVPQTTIMEPTTVYGISKLSGERWCEYYANKYNVDVRSIRYPGIISWKTKPGGGTTDYAIDIFYKALENEYYDCFLTEETSLPMLYMEDAIKATIDIMDVPRDHLSVSSSYNINGMSFTPAELADAIKKELTDFSITYTPDFRQKIADSWPSSIDDGVARKDWNWNPEYDLKATVAEMLTQLKIKLGI